MIRKLRTKLIMVSMLSLLIVLAAIIGSVNIFNYRGIVSDADSVLSLLMSGEGQFERSSEVNWRRVGLRFRSPELTFEARYFSVLLDGAGEILSSDVGQIAAVDSESVSSYAHRAMANGQGYGFIDNYRYVNYEEDGNTRIIFLDCRRMLVGFWSVLFISIGISIIGLSAVLLLMIFLSGRIVRPIAQSYEKQKQFITDAGHEIKTPITIIDADMELIEMELGKNEWLEDMRLQTTRLTSLTNDLIYLSRMEEAENMPMIDFPISDMVVETASSFQALALTQNKRFLLDVQPMLSFHGNEKSICQLVTTLLDNAVKYSNDEGRISIRLEAQGKALVLAVSNTVDVISQETIRNMFDRFYRGDSSRSSNTRGYGIGLSIAKAIANAHKGKIHAESSDGKSLLITVTLPI